MRNRSLVERKGREGELGGMRRSRLGEREERKRGRRSRVGEKGGREGKSDCQKRGAVVYMATGNRPSYVHQLTSTSRRWWPTTAVLRVGGARREGGPGSFPRQGPHSLMGTTSTSLRGYPKNVCGWRRGCGKKEGTGGNNLARGLEGRNSVFAVAAGGETSDECGEEEEEEEEAGRRDRGMLRVGEGVP